MTVTDISPSWWAIEAARRETPAHLCLIERQIAVPAERVMISVRTRPRKNRKSRSTRSHASNSTRPRCQS